MIRREFMKWLSALLPLPWFRTVDPLPVLRGRTTKHYKYSVDCDESLMSIGDFNRNLHSEALCCIEAFLWCVLEEGYQPLRVVVQQYPVLVRDEHGWYYVVRLDMVLTVDAVKADIHSGCIDVDWSGQRECIVYQRGKDGFISCPTWRRA